FILSQLISLVKNFFQVFQNFLKFFQQKLCCIALSLSQATRLGYHTRFRLSSTFFELFQTRLC
ncbi:hypothetical protein DWX58_14250, partial [Pseudoflavonifractor sp. AF19-9AC]